MKMRRGDKARRRVGSEMNRAKSLPLLPLPPPPPPPPEMTKTTARPRRAGAVLVKSVTRDEIDRYWRMKRMDEEEHLLAALKAAARIRARALTEEDYRRFEESLRDVMKRANEREDGGENNKEVRVGIKDWWTKSKYAYLNQPATNSMGEDAASKSKRANSSTYVPHMTCSCSPASSHSLATSLGVF